MRTDTRLFTLGVSTATMLVFGSARAIAQDQLPEEAPKAEASEAKAADLSLDEIVVTAQRRSENVQKAAIAITAVSGDALTRAAVTDTAQLTRVAPSLQIGTLAGPIAQFYVRGVGNFTTNALSDSAVAVNIDGVPIVRSNAIQGLFYDLERIEVLKGPQGTLYGRNATGGAINLISVKPRLGEFSGYVRGEYGKFDALQLSSGVNVPLGDRTAFRVAGTLSDHDGYYSDGTGDDDTRAIRVQATSELTDTFNVTIGADYTRARGEGSGSTLYGLEHDDRIGQSDSLAQAVWQHTFSVPAAAFFAGVPDDQFQDNDYWGVYAQADWQTPVGTLTVLPSYRKSEAHYRIHASAVSVNERLKDEQTTIEARFASDESNRLSYLVGGFFLDEEARERPGYGQQFFAAFLDANTDTTSYAGFGRLTFKVTDEFRVTAGARYTLDDKSARIDAYNVIVTCPSFFGPNGIPGSGPPCIGTPVLPNTFDVPANFVQPNGDPIPVQPWGTAGAIAVNTRVINPGSEEFEKTTYRAGLEYDLSPQSLLYATYETGFKSGGFFSSIDDPVYEPETISAYTLGSKNRFLDNRLQLNVEAFWWIYKDQQVSHFRLNSVGLSEFVTENVGETRVRGIEVEGQALVARGTSLSATIQYLDAEYQDFIYSNPAANGPPATGCPVAFTGTAFVVDCSDRQTINAPEWTINAGVEQVVELGNAGRLVLNADGRYQSSTYTGFEQLPGQEQEGYYMLDLQALYELPGSQFTVAGFVNNVTDENVVGFSAPHPFGRTLIAQSLRPPRTYGVRIGYSF